MKSVHAVSTPPQPVETAVPTHNPPSASARKEPPTATVTSGTILTIPVTTPVHVHTSEGNEGILLAQTEGHSRHGINY